ncbi:MAG: ABC transporter substrate-binding protein [Deltaproteobacteria bacterium]|nr:ABC transporter substrate-binding protein [Deltaproteobacteria bacterium]
MKNILLLAFAGLLILAGVSEADAGMDGEILLGMANAQSGPASGLGKGMRTGAEAVFKEINAKGGIHGRSVKLIVQDDGYEPEKSIDATLKLIEENKVFCLFGYVGTPTANAVVPIVKETHVPLVGLFTGAMSLRNPVVPEVINFRASYDDEAEKLVDHFVKSFDAKKFAVFYQDDGFGLAVLSGTEKALARRKISVTAKGMFQRNTTAVKTGLAAVAASEPDVVIMVGPYAPLSAFVKDAKAAGLKARLATVSFVGTENLVAAVGRDGDGVVISQVVPFPEDLSTPITKECSDLLGKHAPGEKLGFVNFEGCVTAKLMALGLEKAGKDPGRDALLKSFEGMNNVDIGGIVISMNAGDHQASDSVFLTEIRNGAISIIGR